MFNFIALNLTFQKRTLSHLIFDFFFSEQIKRPFLFQHFFPLMYFSGVEAAQKALILVLFYSRLHALPSMPPLSLSSNLTHEI